MGEAKALREALREAKSAIEIDPKGKQKKRKSNGREMKYSQ